MTWSLDALAARSIEIIEEGQGPAGGYLASPTFQNYRYSWFRDGAFIADAMSRASRPDSAEAFFGWCADIIEQRAGQINGLVAAAEESGPGSVAIDEHLHTRYTVDGRESTGDWWNFQLDGYGTWMWALAGHSKRYDLDIMPFRAALELTIRYLAAFWNQPSYDWWEEHHDKRNVATLASIWAGLNAVAELGIADEAASMALATASEIRKLVDSEGVRRGRLVKWLDGDGVDASLLSAVEPFRMYPPSSAIGRTTVANVEAQLTNGGVHRYAGDTYYGGGVWILLAGFLGLAQLGGGDPARARELANWMASQADANGFLPEQVAHVMLHPEMKPVWEEKWGPSASPLLWSHAMFLTLVIESGLVTVVSLR